jgi:tRNA A37 N6-isopentenylltransferase MiaA
MLELSSTLQMAWSKKCRDFSTQECRANSNALGAHGYRRVVEYLRGERDLQSAIEQTKLDVRHYSKRQLTWFRREPGAEWIDGFGDDSTTTEALFAHLGSSAATT